MKRLAFIAIILFAFIGIDVVISLPSHKGAFWQHWPGAYGLFGFIFCLALIGVAKLLATVLLHTESNDD